MDHPTAAELNGLVSGSISSERARAVVAHLLHGCEECSKVVAPHVYLLSGVREPLEAQSSIPEGVYDSVLDRVFAGVGSPSRNPPSDPKGLALDLLATRGLEGLLAAPRDVRGRPVCEALLERSWALRHESPEEMVRLARVAAAMADHLSPRGLDKADMADFRCRAWVELANAYRVTDDLDSAEDALQRAIETFFLGTGDERLGARLFTVLGSQYAARRFFVPACTLLGIVVDVYRRQGDFHLAGRALIMKGIFTGYQGEAEEAVRLIGDGLSSVDEMREPLLVISAIQSQSRFLVDCGRFREARFVLWGLRQRKPNLGGRINELKVRWLEAQISVGMGQLDLAERALCQVKAGFEEAELPYKAALAGLELGAVWLRQGCLAEANGVVLECADVFVALRIEREALAAIQILRQIAQGRSLKLDVLQKVIDLLHGLEQGPGGRFQPPAEE